MRCWMAGGLILGIGCGVFAGAAAAQEAGGEDAYADDDDVYYDDGEDTGDGGDPWKGMNEAFFSFNEGLDRWFVEPVAKGWDFVLPDFAQRSIRDAFRNITFPVQFVNNLLQGKPAHAGRDVGRFIVNTTVGIGGLLDPASTIGLKASEEDFGQTLGVWGVPAGPYLMLPIFGPSSVRDGFGLVVDTGMNVPSYFIPFYASVSLAAGSAVNRRSMVIEELAAERRAAINFYEAVRSAYTQYREAAVKDRGDVDPGSYGLISGRPPEPQP
ncbi:MAG: VacJ family lipoprotein [Deltaproteobacteria bacterium]|nr:VacJ family lipoprotein [Deltaproteobacteria bacterium]MBW2360044.1 VacJ family lipoprotein [Deltaproteobacteria bacterium]